MGCEEKFNACIPPKRTAHHDTDLYEVWILIRSADEPHTRITCILLYIPNPFISFAKEKKERRRGTFLSSKGNMIFKIVLENNTFNYD